MADWQHEEQKKDTSKKVKGNQNKHQQKRNSSCKGGEKGKRNKKFKRQTKTVKKLQNSMLLLLCLHHVYMSNIVKDLRYFRVQMKKKEV